MADIFEEVEEGLRQDKAARLWKKYGVFAYIAAGLLIGGVALNEYLESRQSADVEAKAAAFESAASELETGNYEAASSSFEALASSDEPIAPIAANLLAEARLEGNADTEAAIAALERAANAETPIGKLSLIKAAYLKSGTSTRAELEAYLGSLPQSEDQFGALAMELLAAKAMQEGDTAYARRAFSELRFLANVPEGTQNRANAALAALPQAPSDATETSAPVGPADGETTADPAAPAPDGGSQDASDGDQPE